MTELPTTMEVIKNQGTAVKNDFEEVANAAMELVGKHLQIAVKAVIDDVQVKFKKYLIPIIVVIPFFIFSMVNAVYKCMVLGLSAAFGENFSPVGIEIAASFIILLITLAAGFIYAKKLTPKKE